NSASVIVREGSMNFSPTSKSWKYLCSHIWCFIFDNGALSSYAASRSTKVTALQRRRNYEPEQQSPERRADTEDRHVGNGDEKSHQCAERKPLLEGDDERSLQHAQHRQPAKRHDERLRRREQPVREHRREKPESEREQA